MKILYHHRTRGDGAEGVHIKEMINAFRELGNNVELCCPPVAKRPAGLKLGMTGLSTADSKGWMGTLRICIRQLAELAYNLISLPRLLLAIFKYRPELIYERYSCYHFAGVLAANVCRIPIVLEVNSTYAGKFDRRKLAYRFICRLIENYVVRHATIVVAVSNPIRDCILDRNVDPERVVVTPNAINEREVAEQQFDQTTSRAELGIDNDSVVVGFVGSLRLWHGVDMLIRVIPQILSDVPHSVFLIVGSGELEADMKRLKLNPDVGNRLVLTGGVDHAKVNQLIAAMDIGLMPHSNEWGSPMKILEYMSLGKLCIAPRLEPIAEIVQDNQTGILFTPGDESEFVAAIVHACHESDQREIIGRAARKYVLSERRWTDNAQLVLSQLEMVQSDVD